MGKSYNEASVLIGRSCIVEILELRSISYLLAVYEEKSFSRAAEKCFISQSALSKTVKKIESALGTVIFDRSSAPLQVTKEGAELIGYFQQMAEIQNKIEQYSRLLQKQRKRELNVVAPSFFCTYVLPPIVSAFQMEYPEFRVKLLEANDSDLRKFLKSGAADVGISVEPEVPKGFGSFVLCDEHIILAVPSGYEVNCQMVHCAMTGGEVANGKYQREDAAAVSMGLFSREKFLFLKKENDMHRRGLKMCRDAGFEPMIRMELDQMLTAYYLAGAGEGVAFIRGSIPRYAGPTERLLFYKIDHPDTVRQLRVFYSERGEAAQQQFLFLDYLKRHAQMGS